MNNEVSLCMIVKNEENNLLRCLESVKDIVDEMIIIDTGSTDKTVDIAKSFGAKVYHFQWTNSFSEARNESLKYATKDWILIMDADDEFCREDKERFKQLVNSPLDENQVCLFETLNYSGMVVDPNNISINLNPRLFKNNHGFHYVGIVHNQLVNSQYNTKNINYPIRIYHYGYMEVNGKIKDKRIRNIYLLKEQLKKEPDNSYAKFNIGNEYFALGEMVQALKYYSEAYEDFNPNNGYSYLLIMRIALTYYGLKEYDKALQFINIGLGCYPNFTDLYYLKSMIDRELKRYTLAISALEKCIQLGEPPSELKLIYGTWSFKALYGLGNIYMELKDYNNAYRFYIESIKSKPDFILPLNQIGHILKEENINLDQFKRIMQSFFADYTKASAIIAPIFYAEGYYETALEYIKVFEESGVTSENISMLKAKALIRTGDFENYIDNNFLDPESKFYLYFSMYKVLSALLTNKFDMAKAIINSFSYDDLSDYDKKMLKVYTQLIKLFNNESVSILSEDENEKEYTPIILEICEILLINQKFDEFENSLNLLNLVKDKSALLQLGKLYYKYGYKENAKKEILRSIKEVEVFDSEGLDILKE